MRQKYPQIALKDVCRLFGVSRQAYYDAASQSQKISMANALVLEFVSDIRAKIPMIGARKLLHLMAPQFEEHGIKTQ
jgi:hypothetical protein